MTAIKSDKYIYPPRPQTSIPREETGFFRSMNWIAQLKYNGSRCLIKHLPDNSIQLWNRHGERFRTYHAPDWLQEELRKAIYSFGLSKDSLHILDGELLDQKHASIKDTVVVWDLLVMDGQHLLDTSYLFRYHLLLDSFPERKSWYYKDFDFGYKVSDNVLMPRLYFGPDWDSAWDLVHAVNAPWGDKPLLEGLMLKNPEGLLERGFREKNNGSWMVRSRVKTGRHNF